MLAPLFIVTNLVNIINSQSISQAALKANITLPSISSRISPDAILNEMLHESYDKYTRPPNINEKGINEPVRVEVNAFIRSFSNIDFVKMQYNIQLTFRQSWQDSRLAYSHKATRTEKVPKFIIITKDNLIWKPDTFFMNEKQAFRHNIDSPNMLIRVYANGTVLYSQRISLTNSCPMIMKKYPMDKQSCSLSFASYAYSIEEIEYYWKDDNPVQLHKDLPNSLPCFSLHETVVGSCTSETNTGIYSCLNINFHLHRQFSYYMMQVYIPSTLLVIVSWMSFWLERTAVPARVTLGVTTLLTMTTQVASIQNSLPAVSYVKAIDIWLGSCMSFIFLAVIEFAWVSMVAFTQENLQEKKRSCSQHTQINSPDSGIDKTWTSKLSTEDEEDQLLSAREEKKVAQGSPTAAATHTDESKIIDIRARKLFPAMFVFFQVLYWMWYATLD